MLKYIGNGSFVPNIPARDLTDDEVKEFGEAELLKTGLYGKSKTPLSAIAPTSPQIEDHDLGGNKKKESKS